MTLTLPSSLCIRGVKWSMENSISAFPPTHSQMRVENAVSGLWLAESTDMKWQLKGPKVSTERDPRVSDPLRREPRGSRTSSIFEFALKISA